MGEGGMTERLGLEKLVKKAVAMVQVRKGPSDVKVEW
jgi:hypothetical protein